MPESLLDEAACDAEHREILRKLGLKSYIIVPLIARGRMLGAITLVSAESGWRYRATELELAEELARRGQRASILTTARHSRLVAKIEAAVRSPVPSRRAGGPPACRRTRRRGRFELPVRWRGNVGGDFYDLFDVRVDGEADRSEPSSSWGVVIGDVCGKGAEAAAVLALACYTIRAVAMRETRTSAVLAGLNEAILRQRRERDDHKFCTIACARLETERDTEHGVRITVSRSGRSVPVLLKADGSIRKIGHPGHAIGVFDDANLTEQEAHLAPGVALVLCTDGVLEARAPDGAFFGEERFAALLRSSVGLDATLAGRIEKAVLDFQENNPRGDAAILVLRIPQ